MIEQLIWSLVHRPYVTIFMFFFLILSWIEQGWTRTMTWILTSYLIALLAEWGSINYGFPFGEYSYHYEALKNDLLVLGVPFFDTISFSFLSYVSFSFAEFFLSPLKRQGFDLQKLASPEVRHSNTILFLGAFLMMAVDWIVDPIANLGRFWFLGDIYHYPEPGIHFGVTFANYCGWFIVALLTILINRFTDQKIEQWEQKKGTEPKLPRLPGKGWFAPCFWLGIVFFQLGVTYWVATSGQPGVDRQRVLLQAVTGCYIVAPILVLAICQLFKPPCPSQRNLNI